MESHKPTPTLKAYVPYVYKNTYKNTKSVVIGNTSRLQFV